MNQEPNPSAASRRQHGAASEAAFPAPAGEPRHWVVIECGSKQAYVFATNKQILSVGASYLIDQSTRGWVDDALNSLSALDRSRCEIVQQTSGKLLLLAPKQLGRHIIQAVTARALTDAPGMDVFGVISERPVGSEYEDAHSLERVLSQELPNARQGRPGSLARDLALPHVALCAYTGGPASVPLAGLRRADDRTASSTVQRQWEAGKAGRKNLLSNLTSKETAGEHQLSKNVANQVLVSETELQQDGVAHNGWVGVVHADGNGVGAIFQSLAKVFTAPGDYVENQRRISNAVNTVSWRALAATIKQVHEANPKLKNWVLPIIVGGDDISVILHGQIAWHFCLGLVSNFEREANETPEGQLLVTALEAAKEAKDDDGPFIPEHLSLAIGLAVVKPHFPFHHAVSLAENLERSAKAAKKHDTSAIDFHVLHESSLRPLGTIRSALIRDSTDGPLSLWAGPMHVGQFAKPSAENPRHVDHVTQLRTDLDAGISNKLAHELRGALLSSDAEQVRVMNRANARQDSSVVQAAVAAIIANLTATDGDGTRFSRFITALDINDVSTGTVVGTSGSRP